MAVDKSYPNANTFSVTPRERRGQQPDAEDNSRDEDQEDEIMDALVDQGARTRI